MGARSPSPATQARAQRALQAGQRDRIVRHARLAPASHDDTHTLCFSVQDALNTMDFAECGRLVLVRRLRLHGLPPRPTPAQVSRVLEQAWRALAPQAVPAAHPQVDRADAVFFVSRAAARRSWLRRVAGGEAVTAWFWPQAMPELQGLLASPSSALPEVVETLLQEAPRDTLDDLRTWPDALLVRMAAMLPAALFDRLVALCVGDAPQFAFSAEPSGAPHAADIGDAAATVRSGDSISAAAVALVVHRLAAHNASPAARRWLAALWLQPVLGALPTHAQVDSVLRQASSPAGAVAALVRRQAEVERQAFAAAAIGPTTPERAAGRAPAQSPNDEASAAPAETVSPDRLASASAAPPRRMESGLRPAAAPPRAQVPRINAHSLPWLADAQATHHGGLLFLANALQGLRFEGWLAQQPRNAQAGFVDAWFAHALRQAGAPADDPQHAWFALQEADDARLSAAAFTDGPRTLTPTQALRLWLARVRRALRHRGRIGLRDVVQRRAWVSGSATHLDLVLPLEDVDLRVRRLGLDSDPGWCPWLGRIVAFHFVSRSLLPEWPDRG